MREEINPTRRGRAEAHQRTAFGSRRIDAKDKDDYVKGD